ncbi:hypothetical protein FGG08_003434 [Glutinoglossum americanum]|uniref:Clavaminate synthase-like protein n=1 Tax=Glutinoglossum americanum TaxID=1670608 RepID=A0A9P8I9N5_9PEZI|nr:hypothetical protein FGG08_003434 [Glutinoglossum americanum]
MAECGVTKPQDAVTVSLDDLKTGTVPFTVLEEAFGPTSLGIIIVKDIPERFLELRRRLLLASSQIANLPTEDLKLLECPEAKWLVGWSCGKETLKDGKYDTLKGSYYINCAFYKDPSLSSAQGHYPDFPEYTAPNIWPDESTYPQLCGFRTTAEELCRLVIDTAALVARACDRYAKENIEGYRDGYLEHVVKTSTTTKARLLHYFPSLPPSGQNTPISGEDDDWCATHVDHGCLTGLTSAMYLDKSSSGPQDELPLAPDPAAGLYIRSRVGATVKVSIPRGCLAFQTGEALELITLGRFRAVPHYVRGVREGGESQVVRDTLAVFTQPNLYEMVDEKRDFAAFAKEIVERNHR